MNPLRVPLDKLRWSLHHRGVFGSVKAAATRLASRNQPEPAPQVHPFDKQHGVETSGLITAANLRSGHRNDLLGTGYSGIPPSRFRAVIDRWIATPLLAPITTYSFIDIGCGKGRALMLATAHPFAEIIGVELHPGLASTASANLEKWRITHPSTPPTRIVTQDATEFPFPETPCLVYLYNPFAEPILAAVIDQLDRSFAARPRPLDVLLCNAATEKPLAEHRSFTKLWTAPIPVSPEDAAAEPYAASAEICSLYRRTAG